MMKPRKNITELKGYNAVQIKVDIVLNANETKNYLFQNGVAIDRNFASYPEVHGDTLREKLASKYNLSKNQFILGNGSTQLLELVVKTYCDERDNIVTFSPSFSMYDIYAKTQNVNLIKVPLDKDMNLNVEMFVRTVNQNNAKLVFLCNPNNPTGTLLKKEEVLYIINNTDTLIVLDEAYMEFTDEQDSLINEINDFENLIIARTFSKAYGLASIRLGFMIANPDIITTLLKVSLPYNVNALTQYVGIKAINYENEMRTFVQNISLERERMYLDLKQMGLRVYPSSANFLFLYCEKDLYKYFIDNGVLIRSFGNGYYRITVTTKEENDVTLRLLGEIV